MSLGDLTFDAEKSLLAVTLKLRATAPENGWLEYDRFLLGTFGAVFTGELSVLGSVVGFAVFFCDWEKISKRRTNNGDFFESFCLTWVAFKKISCD